MMRTVRLVLQQLVYALILGLFCAGFSLTAHPTVPSHVNPTESLGDNLETWAQERVQSAQEEVEHKILEHFFSKVQIGSLLQWGVDKRTAYFLQKCPEVTSCEVFLAEHSCERRDQPLPPLSTDSKWTSIRKQAGEGLKRAEMVKGYLDPALYDATYLLELKDLCEALFSERPYDVVFVAPGFRMRGDLVNELFERAAVIIAPHTQEERYGWRKVQTPSTYEKIVYTEGQGITFWVRRDREDVLRALGKPPGSTPFSQRKLRIFFPNIHHSLIKSMALALGHLGHTLVLPGESFDPHSPHQGFKITYGSFFKKNPLETHAFTSQFSKQSLEQCAFLTKNVEVIENGEMLTHPPDVLFANCWELEQDIYHIWDALTQMGYTDIKLAHYSGNNAVPFDPSRVKNLLAVDAFTAEQYDLAEINCIFWIPWIDFNQLPFEKVSDQLILNNFLMHYYSIFIESSLCLKQIVKGCKQDFPQVALKFYPYLPQEEVFSLINESIGTLHIKETEGFGYAIIESISKGRPVFLKRSFSLGSRLMNWCIEGKTAFFFDDYEEFQKKLEVYLENQPYRHAVQKECARTVRRLIDNEKQAKVLERFLQNLK